MKRWQSFCVALALVLIAGTLTAARGAPVHVDRALCEQAHWLALPPQLMVGCPLRVRNGLAHGFCAAQYTIAPHSSVMIDASPYAGSSLVQPGSLDNGNPIATVDTGNVRVSGSIAYSSVFFAAPENLFIAAVLRNDTDEPQSGTALVRVIIAVPETTVPAVELIR